ncbi:gamma-interferon-inducible lysosomal thiol reductase-like isoform X1 [Leptotrombidium deliense]|uniref:Gamma-interferon-inducible lysosomal thiol reductase-like isoform X1 n=1 Tax=Leptotrombidium deliense TaxID=299467 RepID=A0A443SDK4_9ACAR|nr:gamma-interferon-inducible lysosomal thiol reductase-like isoform X1 [Leptotrombidium deliense]
MAFKATFLVSLLYLVFALCSSLQTADKNAAKVEITVYYETHCPDSKDFIKNQLYPTYEKIAEIMDIILVPFGKATYTETNGSVTFECQHGVKECRGNMLQSCMKNIYKDIAKVLPVVYCMEKRISPEKALKACTAQTTLNATVISNCANSSEGERYLLEEGKRTKSLSPALSFVPSITINSVYSRTQQSEALRDLRKVVCKEYKGPKPEGCNGSL